MLSLNICLLFVLSVFVLLPIPSDGWFRRRRRGWPPPPPPPPPPPRNLRTGLVKSSTTSPYNPSSTYPHTHSIHFQCLKGYEHHSGHATRTCSSGSWTGSPMQCRDIPECERSHGCHHICNNTPGSYLCTCHRGHTLSSDSRSCNPMGCKAPDTPNNGALLERRSEYQHGQHAHFQCDSGYTIEGPSSINCAAGRWSALPPTCLDIDECSGAQRRCQHKCINTPGSFTCNCFQGYKLASDGSSCEAQCEGERECKNSGTCTAPDTCTCQEGWTGQTCNVAVCPRGCEHGRCVPVDITGRLCDCDEEWSGSRCDQPICQPECLNGGTCVSPGTCSCPEHYTGQQCEIRTCNAIFLPINTFTSCTIANGQQACMLFCENGYGFPNGISSPIPLLCGESGRWLHQETTTDTENTQLPDCIKDTYPDLFGEIKMDFKLGGDCDNMSDAIKAEIKQQTIEKVKTLLCPREDDCEGLDFEVTMVTCRTGDSIRIRRETATVFINVVIIIRIQDISSYISSSSDHALSEMQLTRRLAPILEQATMLLSFEPLQLVLDDNTVLQSVPTSTRSTSIIKRCLKAGQEVNGLICLNCTRGSYLDASTGKCSLCPPGTYQDKDAQEHCLRCPYDEYQPRHGQTACEVCMNGSVTATRESTDASQCMRTCEENSCLNGLKCDECRCVAQERVCDGKADCKDESDESGCATCNTTCPSRSINPTSVCIADYALWMKVNRISPSPSGTKVSCSIMTLPYVGHRNEIPLTSGILHLDSMSQACHCYRLLPGQQYFVTAYLEGRMMLTFGSVVEEWNTQVKRLLLSLGGSMQNGCNGMDKRGTPRPTTQVENPTQVPDTASPLINVGAATSPNTAVEPTTAEQEVTP